MPVVQLFNLRQSFATLALTQAAEASRSVGIVAVIYELSVPHSQVQQHLDRIVVHLRPIFAGVLRMGFSVYPTFLRNDFF